MFEYFPNNYTWSLAVMSAINRGGQISEIDEPLRGGEAQRRTPGHMIAAPPAGELTTIAASCRPMESAFTCDRTRLDRT